MAEPEYPTLELNVGDNPVLLVGDVHGDLNVLLVPFMEFLRLKQKGKDPYLIYLGDYIDRGESGFYICCLIEMIKNNFGDRVFFIIGNHDDIGRLEEKWDGKSPVPDVTYEMVRPILIGARREDFINIDFYNHSFSQHLIHSLLITKGLGNYQILLNDRIILSHFPIFSESIPSGYRDKIGRYADRKYLNIHGHDHNKHKDAKFLSVLSSFYYFFQGDTKRHISLDFDMSYGFRFVKNCNCCYKLLKLLDKGDAYMKNFEKLLYLKEYVTSDIYYIILDNLTRIDDNKYNIIRGDSKRIPFCDVLHNYNLLNFSFICNLINAEIKKFNGKQLVPDYDKFNRYIIVDCFEANGYKIRPGELLPDKYEIVEKFPAKFIRPGINRYDPDRWDKRFGSTQVLLEYMLKTEIKDEIQYPVSYRSKIAINEIPYEAYTLQWNTSGKLNNFGYFWNLSPVTSELQKVYKNVEHGIDTNLFALILYDLIDFDKNRLIGIYEKNKLTGYLTMLEERITAILSCRLNGELKANEWDDGESTKYRVENLPAKSAVRMGEQFWGGNTYLRRIILIILLVITIVAIIVVIVCISVKVCEEKNKNNVI